MEVLESAQRPDRPPLPAAARRVGAAALGVLACGLLAVPALRVPPPALSAEPTGISTSSGRLRVWLALEGPPDARVAGVRGVLPGAEVEADGLTERFSRRGFAAVRLRVEPRCPEALEGLDEARLQVDVETGRRDVVVVPFSTDGLLAEAVRARCNATPTQPGSASQPVVRAHRPAPGGGVRVSVRLAAAGPQAQRVEEVLVPEGLLARPLTALPLVVPRGRERQLVVDLVPQGCQPVPGVALLRLRYTGLGPVVPRVDGGVRARLEALREAQCPPPEALGDREP